MVQIITVAQQKGGSGKTTVAAHIAVALSQRAAKVAIIDIDPQGSLGRWHELREKKFGEGYTGLSFFKASGWRIENIISSLKSYDYIVIDSPPHTETESKTAIRVADLVLVPMQPSPADSWATETTVKFAHQSGKVAKILPNRYNPVSKVAGQVMASLSEHVLSSYLGNRVAFSSCFLNGTSVTENEPNSVAAQEVKNLVKEITSMYLISHPAVPA